MAVSRQLGTVMYPESPVIRPNESVLLGGTSFPSDVGLGGSQEREAESVFGCVLLDAEEQSNDPC